MGNVRRMVQGNGFGDPWTISADSQPSTHIQPISVATNHVTPGYSPRRVTGRVSRSVTNVSRGGGYPGSGGNPGVGGSYDPWRMPGYAYAVGGAGGYGGGYGGSGYMSYGGGGGGGFRETAPPQFQMPDFITQHPMDVINSAKPLINDEMMQNFASAREQMAGLGMTDSTPMATALGQQSSLASQKLGNLYYQTMYNAANDAANRQLQGWQTQSQLNFGGWQTQQQLREAMAAANAAAAARMSAARTAAGAEMGAAGINANAANQRAWWNTQLGVADQLGQMGRFNATLPLQAINQMYNMGQGLWGDANITNNQGYNRWNTAQNWNFDRGLGFLGNAGTGADRMTWGVSKPGTNWGGIGSLLGSLGGIGKAIGLF